MDPRSTSDQAAPMAQPPQSAAGVSGVPDTVPAMAPPLPAMPVPPAQPVPAGVAPVQQSQSGPAPQPVATVNAPDVAADNDLIEVEWINRAKQIVESTREDPFRQVQQLNQLKADYMQKRYNKTVKLPDA